VAILSVIALPNWQSYQQNHQADLAIQSLQQALHTAQMLAISQKHTLSLCPSVNYPHCQAQWQGQLLIFENPPDRDQPAQQPMASLPLVTFRGHFQWRHFSPNAWLSFTDSGRLHDDNGTWLYCDNTHNPAFNRALSINNLGRMRLLRQRDAQGQLIDSHGRALICH
jgi:Tfp pilus assembly protein FimT